MKGKNTMFHRKNTKNKTAFAGNVTRSGLGIFYSYPMRGAKVGQRLTIKQNGERVDLTTSQVTSLLNVIKKAQKLAR